MGSLTRGIALAAVTTLFGWHPSVLAQDVLEEIVVTAQKRQQTLLEVPISASVVSGEKILEQGYARLSEVSAFTPNFTINESPIGNQISIRGFSTSTTNSVAFEQAVAVFVDGVYIGREPQSLNSLLDIERIEVLRGPQTTFFGQSAIAGALNIQTRKPRLDEAGGYSQVSFGDDADARVQAAYGAPLTGNLAVRVAGDWRSFDGWATNAATGDDILGQDSWTGRLSLLWQASDALDLRLKYERGELERTLAGAHIVSCGTPPVNACRIQDALLPGADPFDAADDDIISAGGSLSPGGRPAVFFGQLRSTIDLTPIWGTDLNYRDWGKLDGIRRVEQDSLSLEANYAIGDYLVTYTGGTSNVRNSAHGSGDLDFTGLFLHQQAGGDEYDTDSHELRITSPGNETIDWMAGVYLQEGDTDYAFGQLQGWSFLPPPVTRGIGVDRAFDEEQTYLSGFAAISWNATDRLAFDLGLRYIDTEKKAEACQNLLSIDPAAVGSPISVRVPGCTVVGTNWNFGTFRDNNWDYSAAVRYVLSDAYNVYAKYTDGYKAGGFNALWVGDPAFFDFAPEEVEAWEAGMKGSAFEGRVDLSVALFHMSYTDLQVTGRVDTVAGSLFPILNAAEATSQGLEADARWLVDDRLTLGVSLGLLDAAYDSFPGATCTNLEGLRGYKGCGFGPGARRSLDRSGETLTFSPEWSTSFFVEYRASLTDRLNLSVNADLALAECYYCDYTLPFDGDDTYENLNLRAALMSADDTWELSVYGRNLTDNRPVTQPNTVLYGDPTSLFRQGVFRGSNYGATFRYNF